MIKRAFGAIAFAAAFAGAASAADFSDPTWPCIQRKVERLSIGLMWPEPIPEIKLTPEMAAAEADLVGHLVLRRLPLEDVAPVLDRFTDQYGHELPLMGHVFARAFDQLARTRSRIMTGIEDYALKQAGLASRIDAARTEMDALAVKATPAEADFDRMDALEEQIDWDERIYEDRRQSLTYVCESPVLIEKRLYGIAQMLKGATEG